MVDPPNEAEMVARARTGDHFLELVENDPEQRVLITGHVLIWTDEGVTYRLETELPLDEAILIAESLTEE